MKKKLFQRVLTAVLTAALLLTSNGVASPSASAAEKIPVEGVYTSFRKATMTTGTTKQITTYVEPENASNQKMSFKSSNEDVATVSSKGLITAVGSGKAKITVMAQDGSKQTETIEITVLKDLSLTKDSVDSDNEVIVLDQTLGNLTIHSSVGDADIYLAGVKVKGKLTLDSGDYSVFLYDSEVDEVVIEETDDEIVSFAAVSEKEDPEAPRLIVGENTEVEEINARISAMIRQEDGSAIEELSFTQDEEGRITIHLEGYSGGLLVDSSLGDLEIVATDCNIGTVSVNGGENAGNVALRNGGDTSIENLTLTGAARVDLAIPTTQVNIDNTARGASFIANENVGTLNNTGAESNINIAAAVDNFETNGENAAINVASGGFVGIINLSGAGTSLTGEGEVLEANVNADNCSIDTVNTLVTVGQAEGTKVQGKDVAGGSTATSEPPAGGIGGGGPAEPPVEKPIKAGDKIIDNTFEDNKNNLEVTMGYGTTQMSIVAGGKESSKALKVSNRTQNYYGVGYNFINYLKKRVTVSIKFDIMSTVDAVNRGEIEDQNKDKLKATMKTNIGTNYIEVASQTDYDKDVWYTLEGTFELGANVTEAVLYIEAPVNVTYYLDNVLITVDRIGDPVAASSVTLSEEEIELNINETRKLMATVLPENAENRTVTWSTSDPEVATVDTNGVVKGLKAGTATITATSKCPYATTKPSASCEVTVKDLVTINLSKNYLYLTSTTEPKTLSAGSEAVWTSSDPEVATVDENGTVTAVGNGTATITATQVGGIGTCTVKVELQPEGAFVFDFDDESVGTTKNIKSGGKATIAADPTNIGSTNKVLKVEPSAGFSQVPYVEITIPEGKKLGDYTSLSAKIHLAQGDVTWKSLRVWAGKTIGDITVGYDVKPSQIGASAEKTTNESFEAVNAEFKTMSTTLRNLTGTITLAFGIMSYAADNDGTGTTPTIYYLDELILVPFTGNPIAITGVTLDQSSLTLVEGKNATLMATITPNNYTTNGEITWTSSNPEVATVDATGKVVAVKEGTATITAKTAIDGVSTTQFSAACEVTVTPKPSEAVPGAEDFELMEAGTTLTWIGYGGADTATVIVDPDNPANKLLEVKPVNYDGAPVIEIALPEGKTLSDYSQIKYKALWKSGDVGWKNIIVEADTLLTGQFGKDAERQIATYYRDAGPTTVLEEKVLDLNGNKGSLSGTIQMAIGISCAGSKDGADSVYYLDDIELVPKPTSVPITGITLNKSTLELANGAEAQLVATITPAGFTTSEVITWASSDDTIVTVDATGKVTAVAETGSATITATTAVDGVSATPYTASCVVTVTSEPIVKAENIVFDFESGVIPTAPIQGVTAAQITTAEMIEAVKADYAPSDKLLHIQSGNYNAIPKFNINLPEGKVLSDYSSVKVKYYALKDASYKQLYFLASDTGITYSGSSLGDAPEMIGAINGYEAFPSSSGWNEQTLALDAGRAAAVTGSAIEIAFGINAPGGTEYLLDDITFVASDESSDVILDFEGADLFSGIAGSGTLTATVIPASDFGTMLLTNKSNNVLKVTNTDSNYNQAVKLTVTLAEGTSISDYDTIKVKLYLPVVTGVDDTTGFYYKKFNICMGTTVTDTTDASTLVEQIDTEGNQGKWYEVTVTIDSTIITSIGDATTFELALGCSTPNATPYYMDDITLVAIP